MTKKIIAFVSLFALLAMLVVPLAVSAASADVEQCYYNKDNHEVVDEYCDTEDGCGFLWLKDTYKYKLMYPCTNTNSTHRLMYCAGPGYSIAKGDCC